MGKKTIWAAILLLAVSISGCGVSQKKKKKKVRELSGAQSTINELNRELSSTVSELETVQEEKSDLSA